MVSYPLPRVAHGKLVDDVHTTPWVDAIEDHETRMLAVEAAAAVSLRTASADTEPQNLTTVAADISGAAITVVTNGLSAIALVVVTADMESIVSGSATGTVWLVVDGTAFDAKAEFDGAGLSVRSTVGQSYGVILGAAGSHTFKLQGLASANNSVRTRATNTGLTVLLFDRATP